METTATTQPRANCNVPFSLRCSLLFVGESFISKVLEEDGALLHAPE